MLCEFDCSVISLWNVRLIMIWDLESHSTHSQTMKPSLLVLSALVLEENKEQLLCSYGSSKTCIGTIKCQKKPKRSLDKVHLYCTTQSPVSLILKLNTLVLVNLPVLHTPRLYDNVHVL